MFGKKREQQVIPLGTFCLAAEMLKTRGMRDASYPFDWIFCSVSSLTAVLRDDFEQFLEPGHLVPTVDQHGHPRCMHALYDGLHPERPTFAHRDPMRPEDRAYYERCIARFRAAAQLGVTFFLIEEFGEIERGFDDLCDVLARYPACRLIAVRHEIGNRALSLVRENGGHRLFHYRTSPVVAGVRLADPLDEIYLIEELFLRHCKPSASVIARQWAKLFARSSH